MKEVSALEYIRMTPIQQEAYNDQMQAATSRIVYDGDLEQASALKAAGWTPEPVTPHSLIMAWSCAIIFHPFQGFFEILFGCWIAFSSTIKLLCGISRRQTRLVLLGCAGWLLTMLIIFHAILRWFGYL